MKKSIKVMIVDDSAVSRQLLAAALSSDPQIHVVGVADGGREALELLNELKPDICTIDINMPGMTGYELTRQIMETDPLPVIMVSANWRPDEPTLSFEGVAAGAVAVMGKPRGPTHPNHDAEVRKLVQTVKAMSEVKVVRRWSRGREATRTSGVAEQRPPARPPAVIRLVAIGASTGGPLVLQTILREIPKTLSVPIVIVQHIAAGFVQGLVDWLLATTAFPIRVAIQGEELQPGRAYVAPDSFHLGVTRDGRVALDQGQPDHGLRPSVCHLFRSVAQGFGPNAAGVLLTGMGRDGAEELGLMRQKGAITIAQDRETSVVFGMPGEAVRLEAAAYVMSPERIAAFLAATAATSDGRSAASTSVDRRDDHKGNM